MSIQQPIGSEAPGPSGSHFPPSVSDPLGGGKLAILPRRASIKAVLYYANTIPRRHRFQLPPRRLNAWSSVDQVEELNLHGVQMYLNTPTRQP